MLYSNLIKYKDTPTLVAIGGASGAGKTSVIESILRMSPYYVRAKSYTTRPLRNDGDVYEKVSFEEMNALKEAGCLLNYDEFCGNYYGMSRNHLESFKEQTKLGIFFKEVHPKNFLALKNAYQNTITVVIECKDHQTGYSTYATRPNRKNEEVVSFSEYEPDITINTNGSNIEQVSKLLLQRLDIILDTSQVYSNDNKENKDGYDAIAKDFFDDKRTTTRNFHDASLVFWQDVIGSIERSESHRVLELGYGNGWLFGDGRRPDCTLYGVDISSNMTASYLDYSITCPVDNMPFQEGMFDYIVASLADPFLSMTSLSEIARVLGSDGTFAFTYPSNTWSYLLDGRHGASSTQFVSNKGLEFKVRSYCPDHRDMTAMLNRVGMQVIDIQDNCFVHSEAPISSAISEPASKQDLAISEFPILTTVLAKSVK